MEKRYSTTLHGVKIEADTLPDLKRKASIVANPYWNSVDEMVVPIQGRNIKFTRINKKSPNGRIVFGEWK